MNKSKASAKRDAMSDREREDRLHQAQMLIYDAWEAPTATKAKALARKALHVSEDCADAYILLSRLAKTNVEAISLLRKAVAAGEHALGAQAFKEMSGEFWGFLETRPYMRALAGLAQSLMDMGQSEEAADCFQRILQLNPDDNQGVRYGLLPLLIALDRDTDAEALYKKYEGDISSFWSYGRVLLDYRKHGSDSLKLMKSLKTALEENPHVADFLTGKKKLPKAAPQMYSLGSKEEAMEYLRCSFPAWQHMPEAILWLKTAMEKKKT
jgi:tetratricopeptide (TPR) repeat protein